MTHLPAGTAVTPKMAGWRHLSFAVHEVDAPMTVGREGFETAIVDSAHASLARRFDLVVDASGQPAGFAAATMLVRPRGTLVVKSTFHGETPVSCSSLVVDEITVIGSRCGPFERAIELLSGGRVDVKPLVAGVYELE